VYPSELRYTNDHEWARKGGDGTLTVGVTSWAAKQLGEVVFVELPAVGTSLEQEEPFGTVESVKAVSEMFTPVAGKVVSVNEALNDSPEHVNDDPYGDGWMITLRPSDAKAYDGLMTAAQYEKLVTEADD
jgi:glycine cleavage system H protein